MEAGNYKDALSLLDKSLRMNKQVMGDEDISNCNIYTVVAEVQSKQKDYEQAINTLSMVWELSEAKFGGKSEPVAKVYKELALVYFKKKDFDNAIEYQKKSLEVYQEMEHSSVD